MSMLANKLQFQTCSFVSVKVLFRGNRQRSDNVSTLSHNETLPGCAAAYLIVSTVNKRIKKQTNKHIFKAHLLSEPPNNPIRFLSLHQQPFHVPAAPVNQADMHQNTVRLPTLMLLFAMFKYRKWRQSSGIRFQLLLFVVMLTLLMSLFVYYLWIFYFPYLIWFIFTFLHADIIIV